MTPRVISILVKFFADEPRRGMDLVEWLLVNRILSDEIKAFMMLVKDEMQKELTASEAVTPPAQPLPEPLTMVEVLTLAQQAIRYQLTGEPGLDTFRQDEVIEALAKLPEHKRMYARTPFDKAMRRAWLELDHIRRGGCRPDVITRDYRQRLEQADSFLTEYLEQIRPDLSEFEEIAAAAFEGAA